MVAAVQTTNWLSFRFITYPEVPWNEMYLLRNKISHGYFGVDYEIIWDVATNYLPENKKQIELILNNKKIDE